MKIVIDIPENIYDTIMDDQRLSREQEAVLHHHIYFDGTPLPKGHGRLIDADALIAQMEADADQMEDSIAKMIFYGAISDIRHEPTIIEADKEASE